MAAGSQWILECDRSVVHGLYKECCQLVKKPGCLHPPQHSCLMGGCALPVPTTKPLLDSTQKITQSKSGQKMTLFITHKDQQQ
jgi:hypothetical protein